MATYNCTDSSNSAYGAGNYGTCTSQSIGAPNTGSFMQLATTGAAPVIVLPLMVSIVITVVASLIVRRKKASAK